MNETYKILLICIFDTDTNYTVSHKKVEPKTNNYNSIKNVSVLCEILDIITTNQDKKDDLLV